MSNFAGTQLTDQSEDAIRKACESVSINTRGALLMASANQIKGKKGQKRVVVLSPYRLLSIKKKKKVCTAYFVLCLL